MSACDGPQMKCFSGAMKDIFISKDTADVTFVIHGKELRAHKIFLIARSSVFKAMLEGPMAPSDQRHSINDPQITYEDFEKFIQFLYTDEIEIEQSNVKAMLHLGIFYDVQYFLLKCIDHIETSLINVANVLEYAEMGLLWAPTSSLLEISLRNFYLLACTNDDAKFAYPLADGSLKWICPELVLEVVKQHESLVTRITKDNLFKKTFEWAEYECIRQNQQITPETIQAIIAPLMPYFDPTNLSPLTLATIVKSFKLIPDEQLNDYLVEHIVTIYADGNANRGRGLIRGGLIEGHRVNNVPGGRIRNPQYPRQYARRGRPWRGLNGSSS